MKRRTPAPVVNLANSPEAPPAGDTITLAPLVAEPWMYKSPVRLLIWLLPPECHNLKSSSSPNVIQLLFPLLSGMFISPVTVVTPTMFTLSKFVWPSTSKSPFKSEFPSMTKPSATVFQ